jgi:hypothetical protein
VRSENGSACDTVYAFETQRKSDEQVLLSSLFESIGSRHGAATQGAMASQQQLRYDNQQQQQQQLLQQQQQQLQQQLRYPDLADLEYEVQVQRTIALQAEKARLEAELRAMAAQRECEVLKRERAELHAEMAAFASSLASELAAARDGDTHDVAASVRSELRLLKRAIALVATRGVDQQQQQSQQRQPDEGHAATDEGADVSAAATPEDENARITAFLERAGRVSPNAVGTTTSGTVTLSGSSELGDAQSRSTSLVQRLSSRVEQFAAMRRPSRFATSHRHTTTASARSADSGMPTSNFTTQRQDSTDSAGFESFELYGTAGPARPSRPSVDSIIDETGSETEEVAATTTVAPTRMVGNSTMVVAPTIAPPQPQAQSRSSDDAAINFMPRAARLSTGEYSPSEESTDSSLVATAPRSLQSSHNNARTTALSPVRPANGMVSMTGTPIMTGTPVKHDIIEEVEIVRDGRPLGLGISGGTDAPVHPDDPSIYISNIVQVRRSLRRLLVLICLVSWNVAAVCVLTTNCHSPCVHAFIESTRAHALPHTHTHTHTHTYTHTHARTLLCSCAVHH